MSYCAMRKFRFLLNYAKRSYCIKPQENDNIQTLYERIKDKVIYNSVMEEFQLDYGKRKNYLAHKRRILEEKRAFQQKLQTRSIPISLKYMEGFEKTELVDENTKNFEDSTEFIENSNDSSSTHLPFSKTPNIEIDDLKFEEVETKVSKNWMLDYEIYDDVKLKTKAFMEREEEEIEEQEAADNNYYGTPNPSIPISNTKCGGCGALLHCKDTSIPGYLPSEIFTLCPIKKLSSLSCQRCHFLKVYNVALNLNVNPRDYPRLLRAVQERKALAIIMVDMTDFPCSIWPGIMRIIGIRRPVVVVGNKVDLLPSDSKGYLKHMVESLKNELMKTSLRKANIQHIELISAKTGYGVEKLISKLYRIFQGGDVYLIGCTNVGKSSLFNALLQSDFCKTETADLLQKATISQWPGTTLNLLKFPITRASPYRLFIRNQRLLKEREFEKAEDELRKIRLKETGNIRYATLISRIGNTFEPLAKKTKLEKSGRSDLFSYTMTSGFRSSEQFGINEKSLRYIKSKWCYDTPGVIHPQQILSFLTINELLKTTPKILIVPRTYYMKPGTSLFIAGLSRLDLIETESPVRFTVFASHQLPITICESENAESLYSTCVGTEFFSVPEGGEKRLSKWPGLQCQDEEITIVGKGQNICSADVVLSSAGWIAVSLEEESSCKLKAWTPEARGICVREVPVLQYAVQLKGKRVQGTPAYTRGKVIFV